MVILGIDTATDVLNLAITDNGKIVVDYKVQKEGKTHSAIIIPVLKDILDITGISLQNIDGIAVSIGPGSFTGLRIGLATAKGLVFSLSIPIVGVNTLEVYASGWRRLLSGILCPMVKARKGEYYFTLYQGSKNSDDLCSIKPYQCKDWFSIKKELLSLSQPVYIFGDGLTEIIEDKRSDDSLEKICFTYKEQEPPGAAKVALLGEKKIYQKEADNVFELSPFYIRRSAAEIKREEANKILKR